MTYFHGSATRLRGFDAGIATYLAMSVEDALGFARWGSEDADELFVHEIEIKPGKLVRQLECEPGSGWSRERATGARYVSFMHDDGMEVVVSLFPAEDLIIVESTTWGG